MACDLGEMEGIIKALMETGYKGFVGQEFVPAQEDKIASLEKCIRICDV